MEFVGKLEGDQKKIAIVISRFNESITRKLLESAVETLLTHGVQEENIAIHWVPGAFEVPFIARKLAKQSGFDAIICLGAVIRGETPHFDYVAGEAAAGISKASQEFEIPIIFGILTTDTVKQAVERCDKGHYAAEAALEMIHLTDQIESLTLQNI